MKKTSLLVALPAVALSGLLLAGCGMFRSHKAWDNAKQESPLEIPPSLDRPSTSAALAIPPAGANLPTADGVTASVGGVEGQLTDGFVLADSVDNTYRRVGQALENGSLGQVVAHDDAAHSYTLNVAGETPSTVHITIGSSGTAASEVRAVGPLTAVSNVVDSLRSSLVD